MLIDFPIDAWVWCIKDLKVKPIYLDGVQKKKKKKKKKNRSKSAWALKFASNLFMFTTNETLCYLRVLHLPESWLGIGNYNGKCE